jgi:hypothetical protein
MTKVLHRDVRKKLEETVMDARKAAEAGARTALAQLGVGDAKRPAWLSGEEVELRNRLRAHARALGDRLHADGTMRTDRLVREIAYEHWHRALFARFLAESGLLVDKENGNAPVTLTDLKEIGDAEGKDWAEIAAEYAEPMLPEIFRKDDPVLALRLPPETRQAITGIVSSLSPAVFDADDSLGWVYQFWQADKKDDVKRSEVKIGADELPAVTQLFTEDYMVLFLLENTLGAWWASKKLADDPDLARNATDEDELRRCLSLPGYTWTYLRFVRDQEKATWRPAAGTFTNWPKAAKDITMLDPCMGSGHFLVFALSILVAFRQAEEGLDESASVRAVLAENLHGLEIDPRCTQIAAFALALASWKRLGGVVVLPPLNLACSGLAIGMGKAEFLKLAERIADAEGWTGEATLLGTDRTPLADSALSRRRAGLEHLYELFEKAPYLGSLIDPRYALGGDLGTLFEEGFNGLEQVLGKVLEKSKGNYEALEIAVAAQGVAKAAELLSRSFTLVATNVPYLGWRDMSDKLQSYVAPAHKDYKGDLGYCIWHRYMRDQKSSSTTAIVSLQHWLTLRSYRNMRRFLLTNNALNVICYIGTGGFETISGQKVNVTLSITTSLERGLENDVTMIDVSSFSGAASKAKNLRFAITSEVSQQSYFASPDHSITFASGNNKSLLGEHAVCLAGIMNGDSDKFIRYSWELASAEQNWVYLQSTVEEIKLAGGLSYVIFYDDEKGHLREDPVVRREKLHNSDQRGNAAWGKRGVAVSQMSNLPATMYFGNKFDSNTAVIVPKSPDHLAALWAFASSSEFTPAVRNINKKIGVGNGYFLKIPFDLTHWQHVAAEKFPNGLPKPYSNDPTQWLFDGHPRGSADPNILDAQGSPTRPGLAENPLQVAVARLVGYRWPRQAGSSFMDCPAVIEPDEIDAFGLVDGDGIVCLPAVSGERSAVERLRALLAAAWGSEWSDRVNRQCLEAEEAKAGDLETWLADEFFEGHCRLFHQTPFILHIWDGQRGGFSALVNYHKLCAPKGQGRRLLEKLRDTYLGEWIARQRHAVEAGDALAENHLAAAEHLRDELTKIIEGEPPYDIFVRWKPLSRQPIGWEPDIDDGVRLNIRPFLTAKTRNARSDKACILRVRPNLKWIRDRGGEPYREKDEYPWFWAEDHDVATVDFQGGETFKGTRYNDFHYTRRMKLSASASTKEAAE